MSSSTIRDYSLADGDMLDEASIRAERCQQHFAEFTAVLPREYSPTNGFPLKSMIDAARSIYSDSHHLQALAHETTLLDVNQLEFHRNSLVILRAAKLFLQTRPIF